MCIKSVVINEKTNEIPTAQQVLPTLDIKKIVTADAMNCQKENVKIIRDGKANSFYQDDEWKDLKSTVCHRKKDLEYSF